MSNPAQEEADRLFNYKEAATSHPEDRHQDSPSDTDEEKQQRQPRPTIRNESKDQDSDEEDNTEIMATMTQTKQAYTLPSALQYANTGPKGVIADAQNYHKAKRTTFRTLRKSTTDKLSSISPSIPWSKRKSSNSSASSSEVDLEEDNEFMKQWRQQRLAELMGQFSSIPQVRRVSPSRRLYGNLDEVDANGYLDAIEKAPADTTVVVMLFDPHSTQSLAVEDEVKMLAYRWSHVRFVKLDHEIAEMETVQIPAILAYKQGDVFATISGAKSDGLEGVLTQQRILSR